MTSFDDLKKSFQEGRLIPFVGAGFSMVDENAPSWKDLIKEVADRYGLINDPVLKDLSDNLEQAEYLQKQWKKNRLPKQLKIEKMVTTILKDHPKSPKELKPHELLLKNFDRIYTTNYDKYFEDVASSLRIDIQNVPDLKSKTSPGTRPPQHRYITRNASSNRTQCDKGLSDPCLLHEKARRLVKYHGDYRKPDTLVLTETSYFKRLLDFDAKDILFAGDALFYDFLFLGYGFGDISLKYTLQQLERTFETLGNFATGKPVTIRKPYFFILRTEDRPRNKYQDDAYNLLSIKMGDFLPTFDKNNCHLESFFTAASLLKEVKEVGSKFSFSSFSALYDCAEIESNDSYCIKPCSDPKCKKVHLENILSAKKDEVTKAAKLFRAQVLKEGFTKFLESLVKP